jgi:hypothetical protein
MAKHKHEIKPVKNKSTLAKRSAKKPVRKPVRNR